MTVENQLAGRVFDAGEDPAPRCPLCSAAAHDLFRVPDWIEARRLFDLKRCSACSLAFLHPIPTDAERNEFRGSEAHYYGLVEQHLGVFEQEAREILDRVEELKRPPGVLLDVGSGRGLLLAEAARRGWEAVGIESSPDACERARARGLHVLVGDFLATDLALPAADVIILQQVVEHTAAPALLVRRARQLIRPHGILYVVTPNSVGLLARVRGEKFNYWIPPEHVFHYSPRSLRDLLERNGFEVARLTSFFCESPITSDLRDICRYHPWLSRMPARLSRRALEAARRFLERRAEGTMLEVFARPVAHER